MPQKEITIPLKVLFAFAGLLVSVLSLGGVVFSQVVGPSIVREAIEGARRETMSRGEFEIFRSGLAARLGGIEKNLEKVNDNILRLLEEK